MKKYQIYAADCCGSWEVATTDSEAAVLVLLAKERRAHPFRSGRVHGVYLTDDPEHGDVEAECEEFCFGEGDL